MELIFGTVDKRYNLEYEREIIYDNVGENIALDWVKESPEEKLKKKPIVFLLPGLTGHS